MFRSVFGGNTRQDPQAQQPQQQQQQQQQPHQQQSMPPQGFPVAMPPQGDPMSPGVASLNPLSRQRTTPAPAYTSQGSFGGQDRSGVPVAYPPQQTGNPMGPTRPAPGLTQPARRHFPELANLSAEELKQLLTDPDAYHKFLHKIEEVAQLDRVTEELQRSNVELAKSTLALEGSISELQTQCRIIRGTEVAAAREQLQQLLSRQQEVVNKLGPSALVARVQEGANVANQDSDVLLSQLSDGDLSTSSFIKEYRAKRKLHHLRKQVALAAMVSFTNPAGH